MKRLLCTCSENRVWPELLIPAAGKKDRGSGEENDLARDRSSLTKRIAASGNAIVQEMKMLLMGSIQFLLTGLSQASCYCRAELKFGSAVAR